MIEHVSNLYNGEYEWEAKLQSSNVVEIYILFQSIMLFRF